MRTLDPKGWETQPLRFAMCHQSQEFDSVDAEINRVGHEDSGERITNAIEILQMYSSR